MTSHERATLKELACRLETDSAFVLAVATDAPTALAGYNLSAPAQAAVTSFARAITTGQPDGAGSVSLFWNEPTAITPDHAILFWNEPTPRRLQA
jgi:hypothetical protein